MARASGFQTAGVNQSVKHGTQNNSTFRNQEKEKKTPEGNTRVV